MRHPGGFPCPCCCAPARLAIDEVEHVHRTAGLAEAFDASKALLQTRRVPWQVYIDERAEGLMSWALRAHASYCCLQLGLKGPVAGKALTDIVQQCSAFLGFAEASQ